MISMTIRRLAASMLILHVATFARATHQINPSDYIDRPRVLAYIRRFTADDMRGWIQSTIDRGSVFHGYIKGRIREYDLPEALIYLPAIESGYNPRAVSPSGAAGLWQFMMNSIAPYDLRVDEWIDERKDFWKSTNASLRKLEYNQKQLGDWLLAIGAYNCGLGRMRRAIDEAGTSDFWDLAEGGFLPRETASYVPKFLAIAYIVANAEEYGIPLPESLGWRWERLRVDGQVNMRLLAERSDVPADILSLGNAELRFDVTPPTGHSYHLKVPDIYTDAVVRVLQGDALALNKYHVHTISSGDTLYALSRHFDVPVDIIMYHNPDIIPRYLQIDTSVLIPVIRDVAPLPVRGSTAFASRFTKESLSARYEVQAGDTFWDISRKFRLRAGELAEASSSITDPHRIQPGQVLQIPVIAGEMLVQ